MHSSTTHHVIILHCAQFVPVSIIVLQAVSVLHTGYAQADATFSFALAGAPSLAYLRDYAIRGATFVPAAALLEMAGAAAAAAIPDEDLGSAWLAVSSVALSCPVAVAEESPAGPITCTLSASVGVLVLGPVSASGVQRSLACQLLSLLARQTAELPACAVSSAPARSPALSHLLRSGQPAADAEPAILVGSLSRLSTKAADSYLLHPAVLEAALWSSSLGRDGECTIPAALACVALQGAAAPVADVAAGGTGCRRLMVARSNAAAATVDGLLLVPACKLVPELMESASTSDISQLIYTIDWQASADLGIADSALAAPASAPALHGRPSVGNARASPLAPMELAQAAVLASSDALQALHSHRELMPGKSVTLHAAGGLAGLWQLGGGQQHPNVGAAAIAGVLKNLPYELPMLSSQAVDASPETATCSRERAWSLTAATLPAAWSADLYGVAAAGGVLHVPRLAYRAPGSGVTQGAGDDAPGPALAVSRHTACLITGGLGGLGLTTSRWMTGAGAGGLVLLSRSGQAASAADGAALAAASYAAMVTALKCDVSYSADAAGMFSTAAASLPLAGLVHAAGLQAEARLLRQRPGTLRQAVAPKLGALQAADEAGAARQPLAFTLLFSSVSSIAGKVFLGEWGSSCC